jgi:hypothetical protein
MTTSEVARAWFVDYRPAGIEGLAVKAAGGAHVPGRRDSVKVKSRETAEVIVGAVTGPIRQPGSVVVGLMVEGQLAIAGQSVPLSKTQSDALAAVLTTAGPGHPCPDEVSSSRFGSSRAKVTLAKVEQVLVAEILADTALQAGAFRHPVPFVRHRPDLTVADLPPQQRIGRGLLAVGPGCHRSRWRGIRPLQSWPTGIDFSQPGCWAVTSSFRKTIVGFVVKVP